MNKFLCGDSLTVLKTLSDQQVQTCVTSPPYYGLRDYGMPEQIGLEETPEQYVQRLVEVFREVRRVLRDDGTLWLNLGDSYAGSQQYGGDGSKNTLTKGGKHPTAYTGIYHNYKRSPTLPPKNLIGIPWRVALALQADGWILRSDIIWHKTNAMPESVKDRPTKAHEYVFLLAKNEKYFYDAEAIREPAIKGSANAGSRNYRAYAVSGRLHEGQSSQNIADGRNKRSIWSIPTKPYKEAHFAVMSPELARLCILAGSSPGSVVLDPFSGAGTTALVASQLQRQYIGIELNPNYIYLAQARINKAMGMFA